ncbi:MAG: DUF3048 domain-containing protein [Clostridiales bacterium]|nr:DUF3048 domain-containing protein [Clostridiales bacterium]
MKMKKTVAIGLICLLAVGLPVGCGSTEEDDTVISSTETEVNTDKIAEPAGEIGEVEEEVVEDTHTGQARSYLTGEWIDEGIAVQRPVAVMMGNTVDATPQYGISSADVVYEAPVEANITRLMPIFQDYEEVEKIMSIRSCRLYYIDWALEFDAIYAHYGQAYLAKDMLGAEYVDDLNGLDGDLGNTMYFRDSSKSAPHNAYATGESIAKGIEIDGYDTQYSEDYTGHYLFNEDDENEIELTGGEAAAVVKPGYKIDNPWFVYNEDTGLYERYQFKSAHVDANNNEQVAVKNILFQVVSWSVADSEHGYLDVTTIGSGDGWYATNGQVIPITWSKESQSEPTHYYDMDGNEIVLNQGKTWVNIIQDTYRDDVTFYATEDEFTAPQ